MIGNDADEIKPFHAPHEAIMYFFDHCVWTHLDEIPDDVILACLRDFHICGQCCHVVMAGNFCNAEDPFEIQSTVNEINCEKKKPFIVFRAYLMMEWARRKGRCPIDVPDLLIKELPFYHRLFNSQTEGFWNEIKAAVLATF